MFYLAIMLPIQDLLKSVKAVTLFSWEIVVIMGYPVPTNTRHGCDNVKAYPEPTKTCDSIILSFEKKTCPPAASYDVSSQ